MPCTRTRSAPPPSGELSVLSRAVLSRAAASPRAPPPLQTRHSGDGGGGGAESDDDDNASSTGSCVRLGPGDELRDDDQSTVSCFVLDKAARGMPRHSSGGGSAAQQY
eukprot:TRINITY_DN779_c0_g1_i2.p6 TRINITY_DN779_c0_g1~~TRINITY_DN779_c0_g1_i2.p6  ORF type:complete len:108 (-),score=42.00 TRINITY_DN779_c0_g1_i2:626-949(-)